MKWNIMERIARVVLSGRSKRWSTGAWLSGHVTGAHHGCQIDAAEQAHDSSVAGAQDPDYLCERSNGQLAALNTWEDDGGRTAASKAAGA